MEISELEKIRKLGIIAMFSDDDLMEMLVLKGGNAIALFYSEYSRASIDLDFSLCDDIDKEKFHVIEEKIRKVLESTFQENGYLVFDFKFYEKPKVRKAGLKDFWGGYRVEFKLMEKERLKDFSGDMEKMRKSAMALGSGEKKPFTIDISKHEFCGPKAEKELDGFTIYVYTPEMMVIEKVRAICQQMPEYPYGTKSARARDFFDIFVLMETRKIDLLTEENLELFRLIFKAKEVPLQLIGEIPESREFHERDFVSVAATVHTGFELRDFDYYFDYVVEKTKGLKILWEV
jgi:predicted nucleotidyltransferase component of viral defense system